MKVIGCKALSLLLTLAMLFCMLPMSGLTVFAADDTVDSNIADSGSGTQDDPYLISNAIQLKNVNKNLTSYFKLMSDITIDSGTPIGDSITPFAGTFDGNGKIITVNINSSAKNVGLFGYNGGILKGLTVLGNVKNSDSATPITNVGGLVGFNAGTLTNCFTICTVEDNEKDSGTQQTIIGGLVGENYGTIKNCAATGNVTGSVTGSNKFNYVYVGGLVGQNQAGSITNCYAAGDVIGLETGSGSQGSIGGLIGEKHGGTVKNCYATGDVTGNVDTFCNVGGLIGVNYNSVTDCHATGKVTGSTATTTYITQSCGVGGLIGSNQSDSPVTNCYAKGDVSGSGSISSYVGGLTGENYSAITNCYALGNISGSGGVGNCVGGLLGVNINTITNCYSVGDVSSSDTENGSYSHIGGIVGLNNDNTGIKGCFGTIKDCYYNNSAKQTINGINQNSIGIGFGSGDVTLRTSDYMKSSVFIKDLNNSSAMKDIDYCWSSDSSNTNKGYPVLISTVKDPDDSNSSFGSNGSGRSSRSSRSGGSGGSGGSSNPSNSGIGAVNTTITEVATTPDSTPVINGSKSNIAVTISANIAAKISSATAENPAEIKITMPTASIVEQMKDSTVHTVELAINVPPAVVNNTNVNATVTIGVEQAIFQAAKDTKKDITLSVVNSGTGNQVYSWTFRGADLASSTNAFKDINLAINLHTTAEISSIGKVVTNSNKGTALSFANNGILPSNATVKVSVENQGYKAGQTLYFYYFNPATQKLEQVDSLAAHTVDASGFVSVTIGHCSDYVLLPQAVRSLTIDTLSYTMAPKKSYEIGVKLANAPDTRIKVYSSSIGVATVAKQKNGNYKVTGVKSGTAYIMVDVYDKKNKRLAHGSVKIIVQNGVKSNCNSTKQITTF